ncbi:hypothetical protein BCV69DRAFT_291041 [Microstroma glucosiphilum]|uniref:FMR1-interacting protein 1 conserved domain-containing protein n=1 Tax=Pseudomicrostroma glucosiphilum TaxID=1684307 RepID=A0A316U0R7_9BASI|nr:hypothetical protein BCV69DRAFT_291041 [Pseudomicrostroma glucosiphilum]PWN19009.1 hypothetical protein BCV69DRAFT_291041 [Pseudomicrostroma glucosiphilum]
MSHGGRLVCGYVPDEGSSSPTVCAFQTNSDLALMLHKADRHLVYPPGGKEEVDRKDPMLVEERKEAARRAKRQHQGGRLEEEEAKALNTIPGLNIALSTPELVDQWIAERKKRWPSDKVVQQKMREGWSGRLSTQQTMKRQAAEADANQKSDSNLGATNHERPRSKIARVGEPQQDSGEVEDASSSSTNTSDDSDSEDGSSSDAPSEEPIEKAARTAPSMEDTSNHASSAAGSNGRCNYGDLCRQSHSQLPGLSKAQSSSQITPSRRPRPRNPVQNPFEPKNLLHALLKQDIGQHVNAVAQVIRFIVRNDYLTHVELQPGLADAQQKKRNLIQDVSSRGYGGLSIVTDGNDDSTSPKPTRSLYQPPSPLLRPLKELAWPPEPDPMLFLDPMRRNDPKPLTGKQFELLATDEELRSLLSPVTDQHPHGERRAGLERALRTLDDLPTEDHRRSALELILGVSAQTPQHAHQLGPTFVHAKPGEARFIGEVELFKLGLRCGPEEQNLIQRLAQRISEVTEGPEFDAEPLGWDHQREEGLGIEVD